jgi:hypothetical protein
MKPNAAVALALAVLAFAGCEVGDTARNSDVAGRVLDSNSQPVRGATVRTRDGSTTTTEAGAYYLSGNREGELEIIAEITQNGTAYRGRTFAFSIDGTLRNSQNIVVAPVSQLGSIRGRVRDRSGFALANASVWAYSGAGSAQRAFTNASGDYELRDLVGGFSYEVRAGGRGYLSDTSTAVVPAGGSVVRDLTLDNASVSGLARPTGLSGTSWTSHFQATRGERSPRAWAAWRLDGRRELPNAEPKGRANEPLVEVELSWNEIRNRDHLGWGIYRGAGSTGSVSSYELYSDTLSAYYFDGNAQPSQVYSYAVSTLSSWYPDVAGTTESGLSDRLVAETLGLLEGRPALGAGTGSGPTLPWTLAPGAERYVVYLFDQQPGVGVSSIWNTEGTTISGSSVVVPNIGLVRGRTYYWLVLGLANGTDSRTISQVQSFIF